jgi:hypothetical protein
MASRSRRTSLEGERLPAALSRSYGRYLKIALAFPGAEASTSYGTPSVKVRGKLLSRWRTEAEGALVIRCDFLDRQIMLQMNPAVFFLTDHYIDYPMILMRLERASRPRPVDGVYRRYAQGHSPARPLIPKTRSVEKPLRTGT